MRSRSLWIRKGVSFLNSFVEYIRSLLTMAEQNFSFESVFRFLRTGYAGFEAEEIDELENYCLALGIKRICQMAGAVDPAFQGYDRGGT